MGLFLIFEASQPNGTTYRPGGWILPSQTGLDVTLIVLALL